MNLLYKKMNNIWNLVIWWFVNLRSILRGDRSTPLKKQKNQKFLICGNGPSAATTDLAYYVQNGYELICVNFFATNDERFWTCKPGYYCCVDPGLFENSDESYIGSDVKKLFDALEKVTWDMVLLCRADSRVAITNPYIRIIRLNKNILVYSDCDSNHKVMKLYSENKATCGYQNVIIAALFYCIGVEAAEILLTGIEMDFHKELVVDENNIVYRECKHFYGVEHLNLIEKGEIRKGELYKYFFFYYNTLYQFYIMSQYAKHKGVRIINLCMSSFVDVFDKRKPHT